MDWWLIHSELKKKSTKQKDFMGPFVVESIDFGERAACTKTIYATCDVS